MARHVLLVLLLLSGLCGLALLPTTSMSTSTSSPTGRSVVRVEVAYQAGGLGENAPLQGAEVKVESLGLRAVTDERGEAELEVDSVSVAPSPPSRVDIVISAEGYGAITYLGAALYPDNGPILTPVLGKEPQVAHMDLPVPPDRGSAGTEEPKGGEAITSSCSGWSSTTDPPPNIRVLHNNLDHGGDNHIRTVDFRYYAKHVLPNEWFTEWNMEALKAGAMAVKMYGWHRVLYWHGGSTSEGCYDVDSTDTYQVYDERWHYPETDQAVDAIWNYRLMKTDGTFPYVYETLYRAGYVDDACGKLYGGVDGTKMSQNGSKACADFGWLWQDILARKYYFNPQSTLAGGCSGDWDCDGLGDWVDNCPYVSNSGQANYDGRRRWNGSRIPGDWASNPALDKLGDVCDPDDDNDGLPDNQEQDAMCPYHLNPDSDGDRSLDGYEVAQGYNACSAASKPTCHSSPDSDGDGIVDCFERKGYNTCISTGDTVPGWTDCSNPVDSDGDSCPDWLEITDLNGDRSVNVGDQLLIALRSNDLFPPSDSDPIFDLNKDGNINVGDELLMALSTCDYKSDHGYQGPCPCSPE